MPYHITDSMTIEQMATACRQRIGQFITNAVEYSITDVPLPIYYHEDDELRRLCISYYKSVHDFFESRKEK